MRDRKGINQDERGDKEELGELEIRTVIRIYYMKKESVFNKREKKNFTMAATLCSTKQRPSEIRYLGDGRPYTVNFDNEFSKVSR